MTRFPLVLGAAGVVLFAAAPAAAEEPFPVQDRITDRAGVLSAPSVRAGVTELEDESDVALHVVTVEDFSGAVGNDWAEDAFAASGLGPSDVLLALAVDEVAYEWWTGEDLAPDVAALEERMTQQVEPVVLDEQWDEAVVATADALADSAAAQETALSEAASDPDGGWSTGTVLAVVGGVAVALAAGHLLSRRGARSVS